MEYPAEKARREIDKAIMMSFYVEADMPAYLTKVSNGAKRRSRFLPNRGPLHPQKWALRGSPSCSALGQHLPFAAEFTAGCQIDPFHRKTTGKPE